jgi:Zn-dependent protease with chaperone function
MALVYENYHYGTFMGPEVTGDSGQQNIGLSFAHPVDGAIIRALESASVKTLFNDAIKVAVSAQHGVLLSTGIAIDHMNFPELYKAFDECCETLGIPMPYALVTNDLPGINAFATGTDEFSFVAISNYVPKLMPLGEQKFIIAHECGHIALGHVVYHTATGLLASSAAIVPVLGPLVANTVIFPLNAWSRCSEITADRAGLICCGDLKTAQSALLRIVGGFTEIDKVDIDRYIEQSEATMKSQGIGKYAELLHRHPMIAKRIKALELFANSEMYYRIKGWKGENLLTDEALNQQVSQLIKIVG